MIKDLDDTYHTERIAIDRSIHASSDFLRELPFPIWVRIFRPQNIEWNIEHTATARMMLIQREKKSGVEIEREELMLER